MSDVHQTDFYAWAMEQAALLRARRFDAADIENIAEEMASMGQGEKRELADRLALLLLHLLKWQFQPRLPEPELELHHSRTGHPAPQSFERQSEPKGQARRVV
jgi:hypothetical protein